MDAEQAKLLTRAYPIAQRVSPRDISEYADFPAGAYLVVLGLSRLSKWQWTMLERLVHSLEARLEEGKGKP
jgi:hypothetical protein